MWNVFHACQRCFDSMSPGQQHEVRWETQAAVLDKSSVACHLKAGSPSLTYGLAQTPALRFFPSPPRFSPFKQRPLSSLTSVSADDLDNPTRRRQYVRQNQRNFSHRKPITLPQRLRALLVGPYPTTPGRAPREGPTRPTRKRRTRCLPPTS